MSAAAFAGPSAAKPLALPDSGPSPSQLPPLTSPINGTTGGTIVRSDDNLAVRIRQTVQAELEAQREAVDAHREKNDSAMLKDINRMRAYLREMAARHGVFCSNDIQEGE